MDKKLFSFKQFLNEQEIDSSTGVTGTTVENPSRPETDREAKSRIATSIIKSLFGDNAGLSGGVDSIIDQTKEVKESLPYKGCGASSPYPLEKKPLSVMTIKILLDYLQEKQVADYSRAITELKEKRAVIIGIRNKLDIKKDPNNQDRFVDALYFIPGNAKDGSDVKGPTGSPGATGATGSTGDKSNVKKVETKEKSVFDRNKELGNKKNEALEDRLNSIDYIIESGVFNYEQYYSLNSEKSSIIAELNEFWDKEKYDKIRKSLKKDKDDKDKKEKVEPKKVQTPVQPKVEEGPKPPASLGDMITPYQITTVPSLAYYGKKPMNPKGVGIKLPGDTLYLLQESTLGSGTKYKMMVEAEKIKVGRYPIGVTKFETYKPAEVYDENCGMQIHRSSTKGVGICVGPWSAGCQVFADYQEWQDFISKAEKEQMNATKFYYALIQLDDIPKEVMDSALIGLPYTGKSQPLATVSDKGSTGGTGDKNKNKSKDNTNKKPKVLTNFGNIS